MKLLIVALIGFFIIQINSTKCMNTDDIHPYNTVVNFGINQKLHFPDFTITLLGTEKSTLKKEGIPVTSTLYNFTLLSGKTETPLVFKFGESRKKLTINGKTFCFDMSYWRPEKISLTQNPDKNRFQMVVSEMPADNQKYTIIPYLAERDNAKFKPVGDYHHSLFLNYEENRDGVYRIVCKAVDEYNKKSEQKIDLSQYGRQYIAAMGWKKQDELVWVNCFRFNNTDGSLMFPDWKKEIVAMLDGGNTIFSLVVDLKRGEYYNFRNNNGQLLNKTMINKTEPMKYNIIVKFSKNTKLQFPDFTLEYLGNIVHTDTVMRIRNIVAFQFEISDGDVKQMISWSSGLGDLAPTCFEFKGKQFKLYLRLNETIRQEKKWLADDELIITKE